MTVMSLNRFKQDKVVKEKRKKKKEKMYIYLCRRKVYYERAGSTIAFVADAHETKQSCDLWYIGGGEGEDGRTMRRDTRLDK